MPLCGFDKQMLDGLELFYKGLIDAVDRKTKLTGKGLEEVIAKEINDMHAFLRELEYVNNRTDKQALLGVTHLAQALYTGAANYSKSGIIRSQVMDGLWEIQGRFRKLFEETDKKYEDECQRKPNPMKHLVDRINKFKYEGK